MKHDPSHDKPVFFIGIDWSDKKHDIYVIDAHGQGEHLQIEGTPEAIERWITQIKQRAGKAPVAITLEQSRGALVHALMFREGVAIYPINPKQFASYRDSYSASGGKSDPSDARLMARMLRERIAILRAWVPDDDDTRLLARLCEQRRQTVDEHTRVWQQLISQLKLYFPQALELFGKNERLLREILRRWSDPRKLKRADRRTVAKVIRDHGITNSDAQQEILDRIRTMTLLCRDEAIIRPASLTVAMLVGILKRIEHTVQVFESDISDIMNRHPDACLFNNLKGAGKALAPRLLTAFGSDRSRWKSADEIATFSGIAPITKQSGKQRQVHRRFACPKFFRQTFHEFADQARVWCPWSKAVYRSLKDKGMKHHAALRKLARSWIRILFKVWKSRTPYDADRYLSNLLTRRPEIKNYLKMPKTT